MGPNPSASEWIALADLAHRTRVPELTEPEFGGLSANRAIAIGHSTAGCVARVPTSS